MMNKVPARDVHRLSVIAAVLIGLQCWAAPAVRAQSGAGSTGASFLSLPVGAQSIALGEAGAALGSDPFGWLVNPALMPSDNVTGVGAFHSQWALDTYYDNLIVKRQLSGLVSIGGGLTYLSSPDIPGYDEGGEATSSLQNNSFVGIAGVAIAPIAGLGLGVNVKYLQDKIADWTARGWAADVGAAWTNGFHELTLGIAVQNAGSDIKFIKASEKLPTSLRAGASGVIPLPGVPASLRIAADVVKPRFEDAYPCVGGELDVRSMVFLRAGYNDDPDRTGDRFTAGGGLRLFDHVVLDYAWTPYGDLGSFHRISVFLR
jgi:hypothetical protein